AAVPARGAFGRTVDVSGALFRSAAVVGDTFTRCPRASSAHPHGFRAPRRPRRPRAAARPNRVTPLPQRKGFATRSTIAWRHLTSLVAAVTTYDPAGALSAGARRLARPAHAGPALKFSAGRFRRCKPKAFGARR